MSANKSRRKYFEGINKRIYVKYNSPAQLPYRAGDREDTRTEANFFYNLSHAICYYSYGTDNETGIHCKIQ